MVNCFNSTDGMGMCLRGKMVDAGILPAPQAAASAKAEAPPAETAAVVDTGPAVAEPALDVTPAPEVPDDLIAATFGLLRAEPDGSVVIAGSGTPGSEVEVYSGEDLLGKAKVEQSGDWVLVPDAPIPPGGTEITLAEVGKPGRAGQSFVVVINDDKSSEPLVVASTPGAISEVLQGLDRPSAGAPTQLAAADPVVTPAAPAPVITPAPTPGANLPPATDAAAASEAAPVASADVTRPAAPAPTSTPAAPASAAPAPAPPVPGPAAAIEQPVPATASAPVSPPQPPTTAPTTEPASVAASPVVEPPAPAAEKPAVPAASAPAETVVALNPEPTAPVPPAAPALVLPPTIDAIEIEGERTFFAGAGTNGATMRLYVDDSFVADTVVADGRWLVEAGKVLTRPEQRVRIDMLQPGTANVAARAEVNFVVELPAASAPTSVAQGPEPVAPTAPTPANAAAPASQPAGQPSPAARPEQAAPAVEGVAPSVAPAVEPASIPAPVADAAGTPLAPVPGETKAPAEPAAAPAPAAEPAVPTLVAVAVGGPDAERFASGKAIIRRGDNLWTIARRVYGEGIKYTTIYDANTGQIRDPDRIYPGQVFELPN